MSKTIWIFLVIGLAVTALIVFKGSNTIDEDSSPVTVNLAVDERGDINTKKEIIPNAMILKGGKQIFQTFNNCGPASLSMALSYLNISKSQDEIGRALRPYQIPHGDNDDKSVTLRELASYSEEIGLSAYYRPAGDIEKIKKFIANGIPVITRTLLKPTDDIGHYRVIIGYDNTNNEIIQDDSLQGSNLRYKEEEFNSLWKTYGYEYLVIVPLEKKELAEKILNDSLAEQDAWSEALTISEMELKQRPEDIQASFNKLVALYHLGRYSEAVSIYEKIENKLPFRTLWYQLEPILAYYRLNNYNRVLEISSRVINKENRAYSELYQIQGLIYQARGEEKIADEFFQKAAYYNSSKYWKENLI